MATFRVQKTDKYTVMSNHHLRNKNLSLKAKGLLSQMLSLPEDWDYTLRGLAEINKESIDAIRTAVLELEKEGYISRQRLRDSKGKLGDTEYTIYEEPIREETSETRINSELHPELDFPTLDNPTLGNPTLGNPMQLNKDILNKELLNKDNIYKSNPILSGEKEREGKGRGEIEDQIKKNIDYDTLVFDRSDDVEQIHEVIDLVVDTICSRRESIRIASDDKCIDTVKSQFLKIRRMHIDYVLDQLQKNVSKIKNIKQYLLAVLYNSTLTISSAYQQQVNYDFSNN